MKGSVLPPRDGEPLEFLWRWLDEKERENAMEMVRNRVRHHVVEAGNERVRPAGLWGLSVVTPSAYAFQHPFRPIKQSPTPG